VEVLKEWKSGWKEKEKQLKCGTAEELNE